MKHCNKHNKAYLEKCFLCHAEERIITYARLLDAQAQYDNLADELLIKTILRHAERLRDSP